MFAPASPMSWTEWFIDKLTSHWPEDAYSADKHEVVSERKRMNNTKMFFKNSRASEQEFLEFSKDMVRVAFSSPGTTTPSCFEHKMCAKHHQSRMARSIMLICVVFTQLTTTTIKEPSYLNSTRFWHQVDHEGTWQQSIESDCETRTQTCSREQKLSCE